MAGTELPRLHWADYLVTALSLVVALGIGVFFAVFKGGQKTKDQYLLGDRRMGLVPVCLSLFISFQSAISLIGYPADVYNTGTMVVYVHLGYTVSYILALFTIVPLVYPLRLTSVYQYLWLRFHCLPLKLFVTCVGMIQLTFYMAFVLYSPALALQAVAGLPLWVSLAVVGSIGTVYTTIGGIKSVLWTDVFQTVIVFIGILTVLIKGLLAVGGFSQVWNISGDGGRLIFDNIDLRSRHSVWSTLSGSFFSWLIYLFNQPSVQRIGSLPSLRHARWCFILNMPLVLLYGVTLCFVGLMSYSYFVTIGCDPYAAGYISNKNQVSPYFVLHLLRELPGLTGIYLSMLFCGSLSTLSSGINSLAANTVEDLLTTPLRNRKDSTVTVITKCIVLVFGFLCLGLAYLMKNVPGPVTQMTVTAEGALGSPVAGLMFLGASFPRCNKYGAGGGMLVGLTVSLMMGIGSSLYGQPTPSLPSAPVDHCDVTSGSVALTTDALSVTMSSVTQTMVNASTTGPEASSSGEFSIWDLSYLWFAVIGFWTTYLSGIVISLLTGSACRGDQEVVDSRLIFPCCRKLYGLPEPQDTSPPPCDDPLTVKGQQTEKTDQDDVNLSTLELSSFLPKKAKPSSA